jgi:glycosyltransferase involved in cell wall biosynthesis
LEQATKIRRVTTVAGTLVAIPCFNEELAIGTCVLLARQHADTVLVIDDGSSDRTSDVARAAGATVIRHAVNSGKGAAVRTAFDYAFEHGFEAMVMMDGDGQHNPAEIPSLFAPVLATDATRKDMALGFRFGDKTEMPGWRRVGKRVLDYATAAGGAGVVTDSQCGYRAYSRRAIEAFSERLKNEGFGTESEQLVIAREAKLTFQNVPISCAYDDIDGSTKGPIQHGIEVLSNIVHMFTMRRPLLSIGLPSLLVFVAAVAIAYKAFEFYATTRIFPTASALTAATLGILATFGLFSSLILNFMARLERTIEKRAR